MSNPTSKRGATEAFTETDRSSPAITSRRKKRKHNRHDRVSQNWRHVDQVDMTGVEIAAPLSDPAQTLQVDGPADAQNQSSKQTNLIAADGVQTRPENRLKRRKRRRHHESEMTKYLEGDVETQIHDIPGELRLGGHKVSKPKQTPHTKQRSKEKQKKPTKTPGWTLSSPTAGLFLDQDPILAQNDKYIILPTKSSVHIYSSATSLLVRTLYVEPSSTITSCLLSASNLSHLLVSTLHGKVSKWDWTNGQKICYWQCQPELLRIAGVIPDSASAEHILTLHRTHQGTRLVENILNMKSKSVELERILINEMKLFPSVVVLDQGSAILACSGDKVLIGQPSQIIGQKTHQKSYLWREVTVPGVVTSVDARISGGTTANSKKLPAIDAVLGFENGVILVYEDILSRILDVEKGKKDTEVFSRRLHWHRHSVNAVKWSRDGNYLISGGSETVLVIWQLETNLQQFLPHLTTSILNISISEKGSSYAIRLADNSVMVLSTVDLLPTANISGLGLPNAFAGKPVFAMDPKRSNQLLTAVSAESLDIRNQWQKPGATLLQTFDVSTNYQTARQALARTMTTALKVGPSGERVREPDVTHIQISHDGQWLVTVDQWSPAQSDIDPLMPVSDASTSKARLSETCLRFWIWNEAGQSWELNTRVDEPHASGSRSVLKVATHPLKHECVTIGSDGLIKMWKPMARYRDGVAIRNDLGSQLFTWSCVRSQDIEPDMSNSAKASQNSAALAYSADGSVIAASCSCLTHTTRLVHLLDSRTAKIQLSHPNIMTPGNGELAFAKNLLLILSKDFRIWDTVSMKTIFDIRLRDQFPGTKGLLAVNLIDGSFVLALNHPQGTSAQTVAFDLANPHKGPVYQTTMQHRVMVLLPMIHGSGYVMIDSEGCLRQLKPPGSGKLVTSSDIVPYDAATNGLDNIFGSRLLTEVTDMPESGYEVQRSLPIPEAFEASRTLDNVLGSLSSSKPLPVAELFEQIASVFTRPMAVAQ